MDTEGVRKLIVIPQTQYQQLIQNQTRTTTTTKTPNSATTHKDNEDGTESHFSNTYDHSEGDNLTDEAVPAENDVTHGGIETDRANDIEEKILQTIQCGFPRPLMKKMRRLFVFIVNFGSDVISFNQKGNVMISDQIIDPKSNVLDLLEASVTDHLPEKMPVGYRLFSQALGDINVPSNFLRSGSNVGKWRRDKKQCSGRWKPY